jgi:hypothetical protein
MSSQSDLLLFHMIDYFYSSNLDQKSIGGPCFEFDI